VSFSALAALLCPELCAELAHDLSLCLSGRSACLNALPKGIHQVHNVDRLAASAKRSIIVSTVN
jgi:hypothetical protein